MAWDKVFEIEVAGRPVTGEIDVGGEGGYRITTIANSDTIPVIDMHDDSRSAGVTMAKGDKAQWNEETVAELAEGLRQVEFTPDEIKTILDGFGAA